MCCTNRENLLKVSVHTLALQDSSYRILLCCLYYLLSYDAIYNRGGFAILNYGGSSNRVRFSLCSQKPRQVWEKTPSGFSICRSFSSNHSRFLHAGFFSLLVDSAQAAGQAKKKIIQQQVSNCGVKIKKQLVRKYYSTSTKTLLATVDIFGTTTPVWL